MGLRFHVSPDNAETLLPKPIRLTENERRVLKVTTHFVASYGGKDRYGLAKEEAGWRREEFMSRDDWDATKAILASRKLLTKVGAITPAGRNAIAD